MARDWRLIERAAELRRNPPEPENRLWRHLSNRRLAGYKFRRQATIEPYIVDFLCPAKALVVEVDGCTHDAVQDRKRDAALGRQGFETIRFTNDDVMANMDGVLSAILARLRELPDRWPAASAGPHPFPSPEGEGF